MMATADILEKFGGLAVLVCGDICLDRWCTYSPRHAEPSVETGISRIAVTGVDPTPGAGGTVAGNLAALGAGRVSVLGAIGDDGHAYELVRGLASRGIETGLLVKDPAVQTFTYTKLLNGESGEEDQPRVDFINARPLPAGLDQQVCERFETSAGEFDVVIVADQAETAAGGVVTERFRQSLARLAARHPKKVFWADSRRRSELFRGAIVKPNREEAEAACLRALGRVDLAALWRSIGGPCLVVTQGGEGALVVDERGESLVPTRSVGKPVDICGAGDSFSAAAAMTMAVTGCPREAARVGNLAASITIMKKGTGTAAPAEVLEADSDSN